MSMLVKRTVVGIKTETTEASAGTVAATDFLLAEDIQFKPVPLISERNAQRATMDPMAHAVGGVYGELSFRTEIKHSGTAATPYAPLGAALIGCGMTETASTTVVYALASAPASANYQGAGKSATIEVYMDGLKGVMTASRGNCKLRVPAGEVAYYEFTFLGLYTTLADASIPTTTYLTQAPKAVISAAFTQHTHASIIKTLEIDFGNTLAMRPSVNTATAYAGCIITGRALTGTMDPEGVLVATHDFWGKLMSGAEAALTIAVGTTAGNITTITAPKLQYTGVTPGDRDGVRTFEVGFKLNMSAGDDALVITCS
jgi:hypothetical protein